MRYVVTAHGCRRKEIIPLHNVRLAMYAYEDEYVRYAPTYADEFCEKSMIKKKKAYKPLFIVTDSYYEMSFGKEQGDQFHSFVECCSKKQPIYDFANGDLLLSDVIELIRHHAFINDHEGNIQLAILTCNMPCSGPDVPNVGTFLHRSTSYEPGKEPADYNWHKTRRKSMLKRRRNMERLPQSRRIKSHIPKAGNTMYHSETHDPMVVPPGLAAGNRMTIKKTHYFIPNLQPGDFVYYYGETYVIDQIAPEHKIIHYQIRNTRTRESLWVDARAVIKIEY